MDFSKKLGVVALLSRAVLGAPTWGDQSAYQHVITLSVDGLHSSDVPKYLAIRPQSTFATLLNTGIVYPGCYTSAPSDSFPGTMAQYCGADPRTTGIFYDDTWDFTYYNAGSDCQGPAGAEVLYDESIDYNSSLLFSGGIDPAHLPMAFVNGKCQAIYPHQRLEVNTLFNVVHDAGLQTAYCDKHPAYDIVTGPSGDGLTTGYFPEQAAVGGTVNDTIAYDSLHVTAWLDWIDGITPANSTYGSLTPGQMPAVMGGNFQSVSVAQKTVGYKADGSFSGALIQALDFVDTSVGQIRAKLSAKGLLDQTLIIIASKHGQAPINKALERKIDPALLMNHTGVPTAWITSDDVALIWLNHTSDIPAAAANLMGNASLLGIQEVIYGPQLIAQGFGSPSNGRTPDLIVRVDLGVIYTSPSATKLAEHGGLSSEDRNVACFVSNPHLQKQNITGRVNTTQVGPTVLQALGLDATQLQGAVADGVSVLPSLF